MVIGTPLNTPLTDAFFISFRCNLPKGKKSDFLGDWVGWVGKYGDLVEDNPGQYLVRLKDNHKGADCAYPGVEVLPDDTIVTTTYGHWEKDKEPYVLSVRLKLSELDGIAAGSESSVKPGINEKFLDPKLNVAEWMKRFEVESREVYSARKAVLAATGIKAGDRVADIGAGPVFTRDCLPMPLENQVAFMQWISILAGWKTSAKDPSVGRKRQRLHPFCAGKIPSHFRRKASTSPSPATPTITSNTPNQPSLRS